MSGSKGWLNAGGAALVSDWRVDAVLGTAVEMLPSGLIMYVGMKYAVWESWEGGGISAIGAWDHRSIYT